MNYKKKMVVCFTLVCLLIIASTNVSLADSNAREKALERIGEAVVLYLDSPKAYVDGKLTLVDSSNKETCPIVKNGRTIMPVRFISESLGADIKWNTLTQEVSVTLGTTSVVMKIGSKEIRVKDEIKIVDVPAEIIKGRTYLPLRSLVESLGKKVFYSAGLIVISDQDNIFDNALEQELIDECIFLCTGRGNSIGNLISYGIFAKNDDWLIYSNAKAKGKLYKSKLNGTQRVKICDDIPLYINVIGNWIYYTSLTNKTRIDTVDEYKFPMYAIYKVKSDGTGRTRVTNEYAECMTVVGNWIYYVDGQNDGLYKIRLDGTGKTKLVDEKVFSRNFAVDEDWIYYSVFVSDNHELDGFYKVKTDGSGKTKIGDWNVDNFTIVGEWIYYSDILKGISKMKTDGTEVTEIISKGSSPDFINVVGDWIYFRENEAKSRLFKVKTDGTCKTQLNDDDTWCISIIDDWIYYQCNWGDLNPNFKIRFDGSNKTRIY